MSDQFENADIFWRDDKIPVARRFDDPYFSLQDGLAETRFVFMNGNGLPDRFYPGFHIAELGFGTGLNLLCAWKAWIDAGFETPLKFTSFEAFPMRLDEMSRVHAQWPELAQLATNFATNWDPETGRLNCKTLVADVIYGDARVCLPNWHGQADAWFLDGFSPAKNPDMWERDLLRCVAQKTAPRGSFATYTAAGHVRKALASAGFEVKRVPGYGRKRHMTSGHLKSE